jgi:biotin carboxyl carrier protein
MAEEVRTQSPGNIWKVLVKPGDSVIVAVEID